MKWALIVVVIIIMFGPVSGFSKGVDLTDEEKRFISQHAVVSIGLTDDPPFSYRENGTMSGLLIDLTHWISKLSGLQFDVQLKPWEKNYQDFRKKKIDVIADLFYKKDRVDFTLYTDSYIGLPFLVYMRNDSERPNSLYALSNATVGVVTGSPVVLDLKRSYPHATLVLFEDQNEQMKALAYGKVDFVIQTFQTANIYIRKNRLTNIVILDEYKEADQLAEFLYFGVLREKPLLHAIFQKSLRAIPQDLKREMEKKWLNSFYHPQKRVSLTEKEQSFLEKHPDIRLGTEKSWEPYVIVGDDGSITGYDADILSHINEVTGANFTLVTGTWRDMQQKAMNKEIDGLSTGGVHKERERYLNFSDVYISLKKMLIVAKHNPRSIESMDDLTGKIIAIHRGNLVDEKLATGFSKSIIQQYDRVEEIIDAVVSGAADAAFGNGAILYYADRIGMPYLKFQFPLPGSLDLAFGVRKDWPEAVSILNKGLSTLSIHDRTQLIEKWFHRSFQDALLFRQKLSVDEYRFLLKKKKIIYCINPLWEPIESLDVNGNHSGMTADFLSLIAGKTGISFELLPTESWTRSLENARLRQCDMLMSAQWTDERAAFLNFTSPFIELPLVVATRDEEAYLADFEMVLDRPFAMVKGYASISLLKARYPEIKIVEVESIAEGLRAVNSRKAWGFIDTIVSISSAIRAHQLLDLKISGTLPLTWRLSIASRNDMPLLNTILEKAVSTMTQSEKNDIFSKWVKVSYDTPFNYRKLLGFLLAAFVIFLLLALWNRRLAVLNKQIGTYRDMIDSALFIVILNKEGKIEDVSSAFLKEFGVTLSDLVGLSHDHFFDTIGARFKSLEKHEEGIVEFVYTNVSGERRHIETVPIESDSGFVYLFKDISEKVRVMEIDARERLVGQKELILNDIHDGIGGAMTLIAMASDHGIQSISKDEMEPVLQKISHLAHEGMRDLRLTMNTLTRGDVSLQSLPSELRRIANLYVGESGIEFEIEVTDNLSDLIIESLHLFSLVMWFKEAVQNIVKHAGSKTVHVTVDHAHPLLSLEVVDDGIGFDMKQVKKGRGLNSMARRAEQLQADFDIVTCPGQGCMMRLQFTPCSAET